MKVYATALKIIDWLNGQQLDCLYRGVHFDAAMALGIAPNNRTYAAAWNSLRFALDGNNRPVAYLP
jgi:hypothetical protein